MNMQNTKPENDRERSSICRKQRHTYTSCNSKASKYNKQLPSAFVLKNQERLRDDEWILNYKNVELICKLDYGKFIVYSC